MKYKTEREVIDNACDLMFDLMDRFSTRYPTASRLELAPHVNTVYINLGKELYFHRQKTFNQKTED